MKNVVGFRILPNTIRVRNDNLRQARRRLKNLLIQYHKGMIKYEEVIASLKSWIAHLKHGNTWHLRQKILQELVDEQILETFIGNL